MIKVHDTLLAAHIPQLADVVIASSGPGVGADGVHCCRPDIVRVALQPEVLLAYCHIPPPHLHNNMATEDGKADNWGTSRVFLGVLKSAYETAVLTGDV